MLFYLPVIDKYKYKVKEIKITLIKALSKYEINEVLTLFHEFNLDRLKAFHRASSYHAKFTLVVEIFALNSKKNH